MGRPGLARAVYYSRLNQHSSNTRKIAVARVDRRWVTGVRGTASSVCLHPKSPLYRVLVVSIPRIFLRWYRTVMVHPPHMPPGFATPTVERFLS